MTNKTFNISNVLSFFRLALCVPAAFALIHESVLWVAVVLLIAFVSDFLDGYFARKYDLVTELGKIIDPAADKAMVATIVIVLAAQGKLPVWFAGVVVGRDVLIMLFGAILSRKIKEIPSSDMIGKISVLLIGATLLFFAVKERLIEKFDRGLVDSLAIVAVSLAVAAVAASLINYLRKGIVYLKSVSKDSDT